LLAPDEFIEEFVGWPTGCPVGHAVGCHVGRPVGHAVGCAVGDNSAEQNTT